MKQQRKTIGYLRGSTADDDLDKRKSAILRLAEEKRLSTVKWVEETPTGKIKWNRRQIARVIDGLSAGDSIIVPELSHLGRSMLECMEILAITLEKEINVYAVKGNWHFDESIDLKTTAIAFSLAAEIGREFVSHRTKEALAARKKQGVRLGRPKGTGKSKLDEYRPEIEALLKNGSTQKHIAGRYDVTEATVSRWVKRHRLKDAF